MGGSVMGMGYALTEELVVEQGRLKTPTFAEYLLPTAVDAPAIQAIILESGTGVGPFGAKGIRRAGEHADRAGHRQCGGECHRRAHLRSADHAGEGVGGAGREQGQMNPAITLRLPAGAG